MGFSGKYNLHWLQRVRQQAFQAPEIVKDQVRPLVTCESSSKTDGQNPGIEQGPKRQRTLCANAFILPLLAGALVNIRNQQSLKTASEPPQFFVRNRVNRLPGFRSILFANPRWAAILVEHRLQPERIHPGAKMYSIRDRGYGYVFFFFVRPHPSPHSPRHFALLLSYAIAKRRHPQRKHSHVEARVRIRGRNTELQQPVAIGSQLIVGPAEIFLHQRKRKNVGAGGERRVRGEDRRFADVLKSLVETLATRDQHAQPFQQSKRRMAFINVYCRPVNSQGFPHLHAADAQYDFLPQSLLRIVGIQTLSDCPIPGLIAFHVRIQQINWNSADVRSPYLYVNRWVEQCHLHPKRVAGFIKDLPHRIVSAVQYLLVVFLPAVVSKFL